MNVMTDEQIRQVRSRLLARGMELRERVQRVRRDLKRERDPLPRDSADAAIAVENDEVLQALELSATNELRHIDGALSRLEQGTFAVCENCGAGIDPDRLRAIPYATRCRDCAQES